MHAWQVRWRSNRPSSSFHSRQTCHRRNVVGGHDDDDLAQRQVKRQIVQGGHGATSILFALARLMNWSAWPAQTYKSATIGETDSSTGLMFVVAERREYRKSASKLMHKT